MSDSDRKVLAETLRTAADLVELDGVAGVLFVVVSKNGDAGGHMTAANISVARELSELARVTIRDQAWKIGK